MVLVEARSRLAHLPPRGVGTVEVECLTSYVVRLADVHCVDVGTLVRCELLNLLERAPHRGRCPAGLEQYAAANVAALNGVGVAELAWEASLSRLTLRRDLAGLTLAAWAAVLPSKGLLRRFRAWCPRCFNAWEQGGLPLYDPLLWTVAIVDVCASMGVHSLSVAQIRRVAAWSRGCPHMRDPAVAGDVGSGSGLIQR